YTALRHAWEQPHLHHTDALRRRAFGNDYRGAAASQFASLVDPVRVFVCGALGAASIPSTLASLETTSLPHDPPTGPLALNRPGIIGLRRKRRWDNEHDDASPASRHLATNRHRSIRLRLQSRDAIRHRAVRNGKRAPHPAV